MWGVATSSWFIANKTLSNAIAFPIVTTGPAVIASLLGVFAFHEIKVSLKLNLVTRKTVLFLFCHARLKELLRAKVAIVMKVSDR